MDSTKLFSFGEDTVIVWDFIPTKNKLLNFIDESEMRKYETFVTCKFYVKFMNTF